MNERTWRGRSLSEANADDLRSALPNLPTDEADAVSAELYRRMRPAQSSFSKEQRVLLGMDCLRIALGMDPVNHEMRDVVRLLEKCVRSRERVLAEGRQPMDVETLAHALAFYSHPANWSNQYGTEGARVPPAIADGGERARDALKLPQDSVTHPWGGI